MESALVVTGVSHSYGSRRALYDVSLTVERGRFAALLGNNAAGKTTLFNLITRLFDTQKGSITVCGHDIRREPQRALACLGVVFQSRALDANLTVAQNLIYQGALHGIGRREALERGGALLGRIGMADRMHDNVARLSGGQVRRVEIARALLHDPELVLCDEATSGLDVRARLNIVEAIHALASERGIGVLWATHLIDEISPDDPVTILHEGQIRAHGSAASIAGAGRLAEALLAFTTADAGLALT